MTTNSQPRFYSRRSAGILILVGVLAGVTVGGGVGVIAASSTKTVTVCANKKTNMLRYAKNGKCVTKTETKVELNQKGSDGIPGVAGAKGADGTAGAKGADGTAGAKGADGTTGADGTAGAKGETGTTGGKGDAGDAGANATFAITQLSVCDGSDADAVANELCKIGMTGPGGGLIFFVDFNDQYTGFNYLEAASQSCEGASKTWSSDTSNSLDAVTGWGARAVGAGKANSVAMMTSSGSYIADTSGAALFAETSTCGTKTDWFLGSLGEMKLMYENLLGVGGFVIPYAAYWSSTGPKDDQNYAHILNFFNGGTQNNSKAALHYVRPVRAF